MSIKAKLYKATAALTALCLISSCSTKPNGPEVYLDDKNEEIVITLFAQGETISSLIQQCFNEIINAEQTKTFILYSDSANFYADEGLSYRELLLKRMESGEAVIDRTQCVGCTVCAQVCPFDAIEKEEK